MSVWPETSDQGRRAPLCQACVKGVDRSVGWVQLYGGNKPTEAKLAKVTRRVLSHGLILCPLLSYRCRFYICRSTASLLTLVEPGQLWVGVVGGGGLSRDN